MGAQNYDITNVFRQLQDCMKPFEDWFTELLSNYVWSGPAQMHHKPETFKAVANKVYMQYVASENFPPIQEARKHVYNKLCLVPGDRPKVDWVKKAQKEMEVKDDWHPLTGEERAKKLAEYKAMIDALPKRWSPPEMSEEEKEREGILRKKHEPFVRSEVETLQAVNEHRLKVREARRKYFLSAYPDADELEIEAYLNKFPDL